ncbi:helix-turn-helix domain-containing protein [Leuconostoc lactis]|uniref:helix-turn-helix domain-containing protein n=1 Tax=Leuconostoc lactis TaxID=1246 RepID=UPI000EEED28C|nr:XRE family transcriptional regulator [Leuconostoc lactis]HCH59937.1 phage repressor protein [Leuconostoc lactis]
MNREMYLKELIESKYGTVRNFSEQIGVPYTTIRSIIERGVLNAKMQNIINICVGLGITPEQLYDFEDSIVANISKIAASLNADRQQAVYNFTKQQYNEQNNVIEFPTPTRTQVSVYGAVSAGTGEYLLDGTPELVDYDGAVPEHDFAVIVNGDSMEPTFEDKQIIFVKKTNEARNGQFVIADYDHQAFVKKFMRDEHGARLVSLNKKYPDMLIDEDHELSIFGVVVF